MFVAIIEMMNICQKKLHVGTGDLDREQSYIGFIRVLVDYNKFLMVKID